MGKLSGQVAILTGASQGIGKGIARALAAEGANLVLAARREAELNALRDELANHEGDRVVVPTDVTQEGDLKRLFAVTRERFDRLDLLVNNAGAFNGGPLESLATEDWDWVLNVNLRAPFICTREALAMMKPQRSGRIINIGSISAQRVRPNTAPYCASKHGLWGLTQSTALEGREFGVTCCCLHPGNVLSERRLTERKEDQEPMMTTDEIAQVVLLMATLPPHVEMLEAIVLPREQLYVGRG